MPLTDLPLAELEQYRPDVLQPADFDAFWSTTLEESRAAGGPVTLEPADTPVTELIVEDLTFPGFAGDPVRGWVTRPRTTGPLPTVVEFLGYGGGRGLAHEHLTWAASGFVHILMDTRGQGSAWGSGGETADPHGSGVAFPGVMTRGILDPADYYYRRLFTDGVRAVDAARDLPFVDESRIAVTGGSQGGGISLAVAGLRDDLWGVMPDVPFLSDFRRAIAVTPGAPFTEITQYLAVHRQHAAQVLDTLSYFDGVNFARRATAPALFSVALMDTIVMPSTVFASFNHYAGADREIEVYPYNNHEGGQGHQWLRQARWLAAH
ncbi:cephalosporin-C deacetylase [Salinibacterium sp. CAN_S4]|uniref:acetylxylan esterase n=1 Tax=Salinibacterium sp. CAN_S4 TaxID=2787727 RepID=UPI0018EFC0FB